MLNLVNEMVDLILLKELMKQIQKQLQQLICMLDVVNRLKN